MPHESSANDHGAQPTGRDQPTGRSTRADPLTAADLGTGDLVRGYRDGTLDPRSVLASCLARIEACEPVLNAFWYLDLERAAREAEASSARWRDGNPAGELDGVPVTIKENMARAGVPMPSGHAAGNPRVPGENSPLVDRLEESGAVILGSTVMPDWGMLSSGVSSRHGVTRSPLDPTLTTGGSSSGAGAAAAAGYGPLHFGSDIGGSIRLPGTWLGLATLKPSFGRVPLSEPYLGRCAGPLARRVDDLRRGMRVISAPDDRDYARLPAQHAPPESSVIEPGRLRIAVHTEAGAGTATDPEVAAVTESVARACAVAGAAVSWIEPFHDDALLAHVDRFLRVRSWVDFDALTPEAQGKIHPFVAAWVRGGAGVGGAEVLRSYHGIQELRRRAVTAIGGFDFVLSPVAPAAAFPAERAMPTDDPARAMDHIGFTVPYNVSEQPAATVHAGYTGDGRTVGVQVAGHRFDDYGVLSLAAWLEDLLSVPAPRRSVGA